MSSEYHAPSDDELREEVSSVCVRPFNGSEPTLHVATIPTPGERVEPLCRAVGRAKRLGGRGGKQGGVKPWKVKDPAVYPAACWCKECAVKLWNGVTPSSEFMRDMDGDAYE